MNNSWPEVEALFPKAAAKQSNSEIEKVSVKTFSYNPLIEHENWLQMAQREKRERRQ